jgi:hypothetical protein
VAVADVLADGEPGDVRPRIGFVDAIGASGDGGDEFDLPVDVLADELDVVERPRRARPGTW